MNVVGPSRRSRDTIRPGARCHSFRVGADTATNSERPTTGVSNPNRRDGAESSRAEKHLRNVPGDEDETCRNSSTEAAGNSEGGRTQQHTERRKKYNLNRTGKRRSTTALETTEKKGAWKKMKEEKNKMVIEWTWRLPAVNDCVEGKRKGRWGQLLCCRSGQGVEATSCLSGVLVVDTHSLGPVHT